MKVIIFCGGFGTRLWPISRQSTPKQFIPLVHGKSFFEITYDRYRKIFKPEEIFVSTETDQAKYVRQQAPEIPERNIIREPERKDLLAACGLATAVVNKYYPGETVLISWAKHLISKEKVFLDAVKAAGEFAHKSGLIVSVDSKPSYPSVHNGWVRLGKVLGTVNGFKIIEIVKHVEKPEKAIAEKLFKSGDWIINTGYRVWKTDTMLGYYRDLQPEIYSGLEKIVAAWGSPEQEKILKEEYSKFVTDSIEYGIFEKLPGNVRATIPADMGWEDIGISWELFYKSLVTPKQKTVIQGGVDTELLNADNNLIFGTKGKMISVIGLSNIIVVDTPDGLLVCNMSDSEKVKEIYKKMQEYHKEYVE